MAGSVTLQLASIQTKFEYLCLALSGDEDIKNDIKTLINLARDCSEECRQMISQMRNTAAEVTVKLWSQSSVHTVNVQSLLNAVTTMNTNLQKSVQKFKVIDDKSKKLMTDCGVRLKQKEIDRNEQTHALKVMEVQLRDFEDRLKVLDVKIKELQNTADAFEEQALALEKKRSDKVFWAVESVLVSTIGLALAPLTLGTSLGLTLVAGVAAGVKINDASECREAAETARSSKKRKTLESEELTKRKISLLADIKRSRESIVGIGKRIDALQLGEGVLKDLNSGTMTFLNFLFEIDTLFKSITAPLQVVELNSVSFEMEQLLVEKDSNQSTLTNEHFQELVNVWEIWKQRLHRLLTT